MFLKKLLNFAFILPLSSKTGLWLSTLSKSNDTETNCQKIAPLEARRKLAKNFVV